MARVFSNSGKDFGTGYSKTLKVAIEFSVTVEKISEQAVVNIPLAIPLGTTYS